MAKKTVKLSLSSTNEELLFTMIQEGKSVEYWHKKHYGGSRKYDKWQDEQLEKVQTLPAGSELLGEMVDYHSLTTGNRWKTFEVTSCYGVGNAYTRMFKFCYWDTYGSVGAFYNCVTDDDKYHQLFVFPSHFFHRYADRMGIKHRDAALVCEFFNRNHAFAIDISTEPDDDGRQQFIIGTKEGAGYGIARTKVMTHEDLRRDNVFEVRTFLKYEQMSKRQREECENVRKLAETGSMTDGAPALHTIGRAMTDKDFLKDVMKHTASMLGITQKQMESLQLIMFAVMRTTEFVSGDIRKSLEVIKKGKGNSESRRLMDILARHIKENPDFFDNMSWHDTLHIVHEWKGDDYDWNKWFFSLCLRFKDHAHEEQVKAYWDSIMTQCVAGKFTYKSLDTFMQTMNYFV